MIDLIVMSRADREAAAIKVDDLIVVYMYVAEIVFWGRVADLNPTSAKFLITCCVRRVIALDIVIVNVDRVPW